MTVIPVTSPYFILSLNCGNGAILFSYAFMFASVLGTTVVPPVTCHKYKGWISGIMKFESNDASLIPWLSVGFSLVIVPLKVVPVL